MSSDFSIPRNALAELSANAHVVNKINDNSNIKASAKRAHDAVDVAGEDFELPDNIEMDKNCDQVRRMINAFIDNGEMKIGEFQNAIGVSGKSYRTFMSQHGPDKGMFTATYSEAWAFFKKRELQGKGLPRKKTKTTASGGGKTSGPKAKELKIPGSESTGGKDLSSINLAGQERDSVPVYDSCDEIRKKISAHLKKDSVVQAAFLRDLRAQFHTNKAPKTVQGTQLDRFRAMKGATRGAGHVVFYGAYCFFEKLRIAEGKPKSKHREEMEKIHGAEGIDLDYSSRGLIYCQIGDNAVEDQYGRIAFHR